MSSVGRRLALVVAVIAAGLVPIAGASRQDPQPQPPYKDPGRPTADRVADLVSRMTLEEKVSQLVNGAAAIPRLDVPAYNWWNEALHGVARAGLATVFPQAIGLAAMWDEPLMLEIATTISTQARAKYNSFSAAGQRGIYQGLTFWSPNINIFRDPRWGRGMETYGEDPYLAGRLAVRFVKGLQGDDKRYLKTVATPKHYAVHSGPEPERHVFDAVVDDRDLRDTYLPQFEMAVREGGALSVMCSYNRVNGEAACASPTLLEEILRKEWGFGGYVVSDCGAIDDLYRTHKLVATPAEASAMSVKAGCDLECGGSYRSLVEAVKKGLITEPEIDVAVRRLFTARFRLGLFDPPALVPWSTLTAADVDRPADQALARRAALASMVLLKNERGLLPFRATRGTIAVIGPNAADTDVLLGNYNGTPTAPVSVLEGITRGAPAGVTVVHALGSGWADGLPLLEAVPASAFFAADPLGAKPAPGAEPRLVAGLAGEYYNGPRIDGTPAFTRIDRQLDFNWSKTSPDARITDLGNFAVRWTGYLVPPVTGSYVFGGPGITSARLSIDGKEIVTISGFRDAAGSKPVQLEAGRRYAIQVDHLHRLRQPLMQLAWDAPGRNLQGAAVDLARRADLVILVLGLSPRLEGEEMPVRVPGFNGGDRIEIGLPATQQRLMEAVVATGKPVALVLLNGSALAITWADAHVTAILEAWYPGQAAGTAVADVLFGRYNPAGRLPVTFYRGLDQLPPFSDYKMEGRTYRYFRGEPLYPFGHGLSYTKFAYRQLAVPKTAKIGSPVEVGVEVRNAGPVAGEEVVQVYVSHVGAEAPAPIRSLQGFARVSLAPGETKAVRFTLTPTQLSIVGRDGTRVAAPGFVEIAIGGKQPGFKGNADAATTAVLSSRLELTR